MNHYSPKRAALQDMQNSKVNISILLSNMEEINVLNALLFPVEQDNTKEEVTIEVTLPKSEPIKITKISYKRSFFINPDGTISLEEETNWDFK